MCVVAVLGLFASINVVNASDETRAKGSAPFNVEFERLSSYLELSANQVDEVYGINKYFINQQKKSLKSSVEERDGQIRDAVYGNLKLMRKVLDDAQYRKYLVLLNVTNNNNHLEGDMVFPDVYMAER